MTHDVGLVIHDEATAYTISLFKSSINGQKCFSAEALEKLEESGGTAGQFFHFFKYLPVVFDFGLTRSIRL